MKTTTATFLVLAISLLALNAYLLARTSTEYGRPSNRLNAATPIASPDSTAQRDAGSIDEYFRRLRGLGLTVDETKPLILSRLERELLNSQAASQTRYWDSGMAEARLKSQAGLIEMQDSLRAVLIELYGDEAEHDPTFQRVFRPLDPDFDFLTSAQQIRFQKYQLARQLEQSRGPIAPVFAAVGQPVDRMQARTALLDHQSLVQDLSEFLDPEAVTELLYRYSPLAAQMRSAGVHFTETEFRETFEQLERLEQAVANITTFLEVRNSLRRLLGADRFTRLWAARDPLYSALTASASELGLTPEMTMAAYRILNDSQEQMTEAAGLHSLNPERAMVQMRDAVSSTRERLSGLLGPDIADRVLRVQSELALELSGQNTGRGRRLPTSSSARLARQPMSVGQEQPLQAHY